MKAIVNFISSLKLTLVLLILVAIWFSSGALLSVTSQYGHSFRSLNHQLVWKSLFELPHIPSYHWSPLFNYNKVQHDLLAGLPAPTDLVQVWLWGVFILGFILSLNLIFGCKDWYFDLFKKRLDLRKTCLLAMHLLFVVVLIGHLFSSISGLKVPGEIPAKKSQTLSIENKYLLRIDNITSKDSLGHKTASNKKTYWTPEGFRYTKTQVDITFLKKGKPVHSSQVTEFDSVTFKNIHVSLTPFSFRSQVSHDFLSTGTGQRLVVYNNPGVPIMLLFQPAWILVILIYTCLILSRQIKSHKEAYR